jgi:tetratricopeptide (TPR) repeat protein
MPERYAELERAFAADRFFEAERICRQLLEDNDTDHCALYWLARVAVESGQPEAAKPLLGRALATRMLPEYLHGMARSLRRRGFNQLAAELLYSALERFPQDAAIIARLGQVLADIGQLEDAEALLRRAVEIDPGLGSAYYSLSVIRHFEVGDPVVGRMESAIGATAPGSESRRDLSFALGRAYQDQGRYDAAFELFVVGNRIKRASTTYDPEHDAQQTAELIAAVTAEFMHGAAGAGIDDEAPLLIVGMPRSGTTLVEQIIAAHPEAIGVGERLDLPEVVETQIFKYLPPQPQLPTQVNQVRPEAWAAMGRMYADRMRALDPDAKRIADKQLYNFKMLGLFHLMLPRARIVFCRRDPMDAGLSCFSSLFDAGSDFIYDLWEIGHAWRLHDELMAHWQSLFGDRIHTVQYETLVSDPETEVRRLIDAIGLPWSEDCLTFHDQARNVSTMSVAQVRKPIYQSSVGRWQAYGSHLDPLRAGLDGQPRPPSAQSD